MSGSTLCCTSCAFDSYELRFTGFTLCVSHMRNFISASYRLRSALAFGTTITLNVRLHTGLSHTICHLAIPYVLEMNQLLSSINKLPASTL